MNTLPPNLMGIIMASLSALVWGSADFTGGFATRRKNQYQVLLLTALSGLVVLVVAALIKGEALPSLRDVLWAALAGVTGTVGITALYKGLAVGDSAVVAPTSAVIGAGLPVAFSLFTYGLPDPTHLIGFGLALAGIWIVSQTALHKSENARKGFYLAIVAGLGFAGFMIFISRVDPAKIYTPLIVSRVIVVLGASALLWINHVKLPPLRHNGIALLAGVLDVGGNIFFMLAKFFTRLDTAVVISGLYPAVTVVLAGVFLKEKIGLKQWVGVFVCLAAIILITL